MHKFKRPYVRASGSVDKAVSRRQKSVTNSMTGDWDFRVPNHLSPKDESVHDSITSFGSTNLYPLHFSNRKKTTHSEFPDTIIEGEQENKMDETLTKKHGTAQK